MNALQGLAACQLPVAFRRVLHTNHLAFSDGNADFDITSTAQVLPASEFGLIGSVRDGKLL